MSELTASPPPVHDDPSPTVKGTLADPPAVARIERTVVGMGFVVVILLMVTATNPMVLVFVAAGVVGVLIIVARLWVRGEAHLPVEMTARDEGLEVVETPHGGDGAAPVLVPWSDLAPMAKAPRGWRGVDEEETLGLKWRGALTVAKVPRRGAPAAVDAFAARARECVAAVPDASRTYAMVSPRENRRRLILLLLYSLAMAAPAVESLVREGVRGPGLKDWLYLVGGLVTAIVCGRALWKMRSAPTPPAELDADAPPVS